MLLLAAADGAGSAPRAAEGADLAVASALHWAAAGARAGRALADVLTGACRCARVCLAMWGPLSDLATTLAVAATTPNEIAIAQIGDGAAVVRHHDGFRLLSPCSRGEYFNETVFLTSENWSRHLRVDVMPAEGITGIALLTDGLQLVALDLAAARPHDGFFGPLFDFARDGTSDDLETFLSSPRFAQRTDDDKTLVLAVPA